MPTIKESVCNQAQTTGYAQEQEGQIKPCQKKSKSAF